MSKYIIRRVLTHTTNGGSKVIAELTGLGPGGTPWRDSRENVIRFIALNGPFVTFVARAPEWPQIPEAPVVLAVGDDGSLYLKTEPDVTWLNNLLHLPKFTLMDFCVTTGLPRT